MSGIAPDDATAQVRVEGDVSDKKVEDVHDQNEMGGMPSRQEEEAVIKKKYGGILPRKTPLISKDHERAYFDSADWALGKVVFPTSLKVLLKHFDPSFSLLNRMPVPAELLMHLRTVMRL
ncbi:unnamed protein product [Urochloa decumbens]|uniref:cAMP-regulated phosphoprotein 19-related protein n=1 Tax=Urochloa decumbens TaxID=240449 RepID=A0ABC8W6A7_9POAL